MKRNFIIVSVLVTVVLSAVISSSFLKKRETIW